VDTYNNKILNLIPGQNWIAKAIDVCLCDISEDQKKEVMSRIASKNVQETHGLPSALILKLGIEYMMRINVGITDGLVNGAVGRLQRVDTAQHPCLGEIPSRLWLQFEGHNVGSNIRARFSKLMKSKNYGTQQT
jgi:hypothetical protein